MLALLLFFFKKCKMANKHTQVDFIVFIENRKVLERHNYVFRVFNLV